MDRVERIAKHMVGSGASPASVKEGRPPITSHVLDTVSGRPAAGVKVVLDMLDGKEWKQVCHVSESGVGKISSMFLYTLMYILAETIRCLFIFRRFLSTLQIVTAAVKT